MYELYLVIGSDSTLGRSLEDVVERAVAGGVTAVQLREKTTSAKEFFQGALRLKRCLKPLGIPLIINDRVDIAMACGAEGVHIGQNDMPVAVVRSLMPGALIGLSVETMEQAIAAESFNIDYLGVSPIFKSSTKPELTQPWALHGLRALRSVSSHTLVAIGGIDLSNARDVLQAGADGIAVVSAIAQAHDPEQAAIQLKTLIFQVKQQEK